MFIDTITKLRVNIYSPYKGYSKLDTPALRTKACVEEIPDPTPPEDYSEDNYYRTEQNEEPYVIYTRKSDEQILAARWNKIKAIRDTLITNGGVLVDLKWYHSDTHSKLQQISLMLAGTNLPSNIKWKTMNGTYVDMTPTLAVQIYQAQMAQEQSIFAKAEEKKLDQSNINEGWPEVYQE